MQAIRHWLDSLFHWLLRKDEAKAELAAAREALKRRSEQEQAVWETRDELWRQPGAPPRSVGQEEFGRGNREDRSERIAQPSPLASENHDIPFTALPPPVETIVEPPHTREEATLASAALVPATPTTDQQLAFLRYLVKRGIVNEGFAQGEEPEQYNS